jgi:hypothetical protein
MIASCLDQGTLHLHEILFKFPLFLLKIKKYFQNRNTPVKAVEVIQGKKLFFNN